MEPASIRYNNPGAMWGGSALARKWGATKTVGLNDGLGQGNNIAVFPTKVRGGAAQFDLWHTSAFYHNKSLLSAITKWSGGNWVASYTSFLKKRVDGLTDQTVISDPFMASEKGIQFVKAQAWHEAGKPYPMSDTEWRAAQELVHGKNAIKLPDPVKHTGGQVATQTVAVASGLSAGKVILVAVVIAAIGIGLYLYLKSRQQKKLDAQIEAAEAALAAAQANQKDAPVEQV